MFGIKTRMIVELEKDIGSVYGGYNSTCLCYSANVIIKTVSSVSSIRCKNFCCPVLSLNKNIPVNITLLILAGYQLGTKNKEQCYSSFEIEKIQKSVNQEKILEL